MKHLQIRAKIEKNIEVCPGIYRLTFINRKLAELSRPGQFLMVKVARTPAIEPVLRRPFSIHQVKDDRISILFKVIGRGTENLAKTIDEVDLIGPLGKGYQIPSRGHIALIGGGMGVAPLLFLGQCCRKLKQKGREILILLGARTVAEMPAAEDFRQLGLPLKTATDDGTAGYHGLITDLMEGNMAGGNWSVMTCGPQPMMNEVADQCFAQGWNCQVSLETTMACGMGACLGCAVQGKGRESYLHVCKDGPVFSADQVDW